jgi:cellulose synthase/poly-beta-1,6-N-acetylglucosamine synthase-like glycosyltransferase
MHISEGLPGFETGSEGISIVVPVSGRTQLVEELLKSLQSACANFLKPYELVLLDNSPVSQRDKMRELSKDYGARFIDGSSNLSLKRNQALEVTEYDTILFLDSDVTVHPDLLNQHYAGYGDKRTGGCLGLVIFTGEDTFIWNAVERTHVIDCFSVPCVQEFTNWGPTANISFRRKVLAEVGGFDSSFDQPGGEDVDLGFRIEDAGYSIACNREAVVYHTKKTWAGYRQIGRRFITYGTADALLIKKHFQRTVWELPTPSMIFVVSLIFAIVTSLVSELATWLLYPLAWLFAAISIQSVVNCKFINNNINQRELALDMMSTILLAHLDIARVWGSFKHKEPRAFYRKILFYENQQPTDWPSSAGSLLSALLSSFLTLFIFSWLLK